VTPGEGDFRAYGPSHVTVLVVLVAVAAGLVLMGRRLRGGPLEPLLSRTLALILLTTNLGFQVYSMLPRNWAIEHSLPLELCDLAWMAAVIGLSFRSCWACWLAYYWALTLTVQALLTPNLRYDLPRMEFVMFFSTHSLTVLATVYLTWGVGIARPTWRGWAFTSLVTVAWGVLMLAFNALAGTNYLYVTRKPDTPSLLDYFGPWPLYLFVELAVGLAVWALITWPWEKRRGDNGERPPDSRAYAG
jgi:hypothetical integral membrane protein (TIGR02206 family)